MEVVLRCLHASNIKLKYQCVILHAVASSNFFLADVVNSSTEIIFHSPVNESVIIWVSLVMNHCTFSWTHLPVHIIKQQFVHAHN